MKNRMSPLCSRMLWTLACLQTIHVVSAVNDTVSPSATINVAGVTLQLPLKLTVISAIYCNYYDTTCSHGRSVFDKGYFGIGAVSVALQDIRKDHALKMFHDVNLTVLDTKSVLSFSLRHVVAASNNESLAILGLDKTCQQEKAIASLSDKLAISYYCDQVENRKSNEQMADVRLNTQIVDIAKAMVEYLLKVNWKRVTVVQFISPDTLEPIKPFWDELRNRLFAEQFDVVQTLYSYVFFGTVYIFIACQPYAYDSTFFLDAMSRMGLLQTGEYVILWSYPVDINKYYNGTVETSGYYYPSYGIPNQASALKRVPTERESFQFFRSVLFFTVTTALPTEAWKNFSIRLLQEHKRQTCPPLCNLTLFQFDSQPLWNGVSTSAGLLYDSIVHYVKVASTLISKNATNIKSGSAMMQYFRNTKIDSITGLEIHLDNNGRAIGNISISTATPDGMLPVARYFYNESDEENHRYIALLPNRSMNWLFGTTPNVHPKCGFKGEYCQSKQYYITMVAAFVTVSATIVLLTVAGFAYRRVQFNKEMQRLLWKIESKNLVLQASNLDDLKSINNSNIMALQSATSIRMYNSQADLRQGRKNGIAADPREATISQRDLAAENNQARLWKQLKGFGTAIYNGNITGVKRLRKTKLDLTRSVKIELQMAVKTKNANLIPILGFVYEPPLIAVVSQHCQRGSLRDILITTEIKLDRIFIASLVYDIIHGLQYLQTTVFRCHGNLKSTNCLVDSRWTVRLSGFGLHLLRHGEEQYLTEREKCMASLWTAPEILRDNYSLRTRKTEEADVYSFGLILYEIYGRAGPFGDELLDPIDIIRRVKDPPPHEPLMRPNIDLVLHAPDFVRDTMKQCWSEQAEDRPEIRDIKTKLQPLRAGLKNDLVANVMAMLDKYSTNLEELINDRVNELIDEQQRSECLLKSMLPLKAIEALKRGETVEPELFESVTLYFSDIVGFKTSVSHKNPYETVHFLHVIYSEFDRLVDDYDVYKVETIADTYMVASGVPRRNDNRHPGEIASMALRLLKAAKGLAVELFNGDVVKLRIGIHTGACMAGVIGLTMPRYCLFGDTVNTASRLTSNGEALKIQCSGECKLKLDELGGYELAERGYVKMKGLGEKLTYWLLDENIEIRKQRMNYKN